MEHSRYISFSVQCDICTRARSLDSRDFDKKIIKCENPDCDNEFTVYQGIKTGLKSKDNELIPKTFLSRDIFKNMFELKLGYSLYVELPSTISKINKVNLFPFSEGNYMLGTTEIDNSGFRIMSSLNVDTNPSDVGKQISVFAMVHAKTEEYEEPWIHLLSYALEQYNSKDYMTSVLLSEIAFETYVDTTLSEGYKVIGLDEDSITRFIEATTMPIKVNSLMNNLFGIKLSSMKNYNVWEKKVLKMRNFIAHGKKTTVTEEEAKLAYDTIVDAIFHFVEGVDTYMKNITN